VGINLGVGDWGATVSAVGRAHGPIAWCWAALRDQKDEWELAVLSVRGSTRVSAQTLAYPRLFIRTESLSPRVAAKRLGEGKTGRAPGLPQGLDIQAEGSSMPMWLTTEPGRHKQWVTTDWPGWYATHSLRGGPLHGFNDLWLPADARSHRYFPTGFAAVATEVYATPPFWLGTRQERHVVVWLPDRRMRLGDIRFEKAKVRVQYETGNRFDRRVLVKAAWRLRLGDVSYSHAELRPTKPSGWFSFLTKSLPVEFSVELSDRGAMLDRRGWSESAGRAPLDESSLEAQVAAWLIEGEGLQLEFKERLGAGANREFAESVASFANGSGGVILLGVSDNAEVKGFSGAKVKDTITNVVRSQVLDYIEVGTTQLRFDAKPLYVIRVPQGARPPYQVGGKTMIRAGGTDRAAMPNELRGLASKAVESLSRVGLDVLHRGW
jgi:hypothetical protein